MQTFVCVNVTLREWQTLIALSEPTDINPGPLTQILYAFADVSPDTGAISLTDSYADEQVMSFLSHQHIYKTQADSDPETLPR